MNKEEVPQEAITYIVLLSAMQVVLNTSLELQGTKYYSSKVKEKCKEAINALTQYNSKNHQSIWNLDSEMSAKMMYGIQAIGEQIAKGKPEVLGIIADLHRDGLDLNNYKLIEIDGISL